MKNNQFFNPALIIFIIANIAVSCNSSINGLDDTSLSDAMKSQESTSTNAVDLTILVKDNYNGKYLYKIEIFENDPNIAVNNAYKTGYGSKDIWFKTTLQIQKQTNTLYIRQTDPLNNQMLKSVEIPAGSNSIVCNFN